MLRVAGISKLNQPKTRGQSMKKSFTINATRHYVRNSTKCPEWLGFKAANSGCIIAKPLFLFWTNCVKIASPGNQKSRVSKLHKSGSRRLWLNTGKSSYTLRKKIYDHISRTCSATGYTIYLCYGQPLAGRTFVKYGHTNPRCEG